MFAKFLSEEPCFLLFDFAALLSSNVPDVVLNLQF